MILFGPTTLHTRFLLVCLHTNLYLGRLVTLEHKAMWAMKILNLYWIGASK